MPKPVTFAVRFASADTGLARKRSADAALPGLSDVGARADVNTFRASECTPTPTGVSGIRPLARQPDVRLNFEVRAPLVGLFSTALQYGPVRYSIRRRGPGLVSRSNAGDQWRLNGYHERRFRRARQQFGYLIAEGNVVNPSTATAG
jgi:hypothetical protein